MLVPIVLAILGGIAISIQGQFMGLIEQGMGTKESVFITYAGGGIVIALVMIATQGGELKSWPDVPWYTLTSGLFGLLIVSTISYVVPQLGLVPSFTLMVAAQFITAMLINQYGWFDAMVIPIDASKILGLGTLLVGIWLLIRP